MKQHRFTLEEIDARRAELRQQIRVQQNLLQKKYEQTFQAPVVDTKFQSWMNKADAAFSLFDGFMTGFKIFKSLRSVFRHFRQEASDKET